jgi:hypothetical protein
MKSQLNEVQKLQKLAGIVKENINEAPLTINQVVKQLNKIANSKGFYAVDKSKDQKPIKSASGVKNLVKWEDGSGAFVELYYNTMGSDSSNITVDDLEINFAGDVASGNDPVEDWLNPETWDYNFNEEDEESEDNY